MAPALTVLPQESHNYLNGVIEPDKPLYHQRRSALTSVYNISIPMEGDDMSLQNQPNLAKDSQEMEQILVELGNSDLGQVDLLQAIKTFESTGDTLSTGDADAIFPLSGFDLADTIDSEGDTAEDKIKLVQARLERRCSFLQRRLRILQARAIGKRVSEEVSQTFDKSTRGARKDGGGRPIGLKALLKRIETTAALQASAASRSVTGPKYYRAGCSKGDASKSASIGIQSGTLAGLEHTAGALNSHLSVVKKELDSDATASSSGAESNDEAVAYNNPHQQHMAIEKRALWSWQTERASIASRWCWLQAQVQELDYKIRQHNELHKQIRDTKGAVEFDGEPMGYEGVLPGSNLQEDDPATETCARHRPLRRETFRKRKLLQMHNLHIATNKAAKPSDIKCSCQYPMQSCAVCTGRAEPMQPLPPLSTLTPAQKLALIDPGYHPVLSDIKDVSPSIHLSALTSRTWFRSRFHKSFRGAHHSSVSRQSQQQSHQKTHPSTAAKSVKQQQTRRLKRGRPPLSRKMKEREREEDSSTPLSHDRPRGRSSTENKTSRQQSYDIDNIVIPQSIAANTKPEILTYKEIITPKWRLLEIPEVSLNNGVMKSSRMSIESEEEDISEATVSARHTRAERAERSRYARKPNSRRANNEQNNEVPLPPLPASPPLAPLPDTHHEAVRPYTPRNFPLTEDTYHNMLALMPDGYRPRSPAPSLSKIEEDDDESTLSPMSPLFFEGDDPDDDEWDPSAEKVERRKSSFR